MHTVQCVAMVVGMLRMSGVLRYCICNLLHEPDHTASPPNPKVTGALGPNCAHAGLCGTGAPELSSIRLPNGETYGGNARMVFQQRQATAAWVMGMLRSIPVCMHQTINKR